MLKIKYPLTRIILGGIVNSLTNFHNFLNKLIYGLRWNEW